ncbi:hypothetical protein B0H14DRAFT_2602879 [Mycena olivaceomarginata]|nr:hypothetical protein B0H14DRAFT_2602879 [Mycena olivaceomarginata]
MWGTDSSMILASASLCESRRVTAAVTGPLTLVQLSGRNLSILHGELMGHVLALVLQKDSKGNAVPTLYSDHQNSVELIGYIQNHISQDSRLRGMNGRSYYHWILALVREGHVNMMYMRGHSAELSIPAQPNREADHYASGSQKFPPFSTSRTDPDFYNGHLHAVYQSRWHYQRIQLSSSSMLALTNFRRQRHWNRGPDSNPVYVDGVVTRWRACIIFLLDVRNSTNGAGTRGRRCHYVQSGSLRRRTCEKKTVSRS